MEQIILLCSINFCKSVLVHINHQPDPCLQMEHMHNYYFGLYYTTKPKGLQKEGAVFYKRIIRLH